MLCVLRINRCPLSVLDRRHYGTVAIAIAPLAAQIVEWEHGAVQATFKVAHNPAIDESTQYDGTDANDVW
jgi:hypothetical protein